MAQIQKIRALEVLDSRGNPTIEAVVYTENGIFTAMVPSGASTGKHEAVERRDGGKRYGGKGVSKVVRIIEEVIAPELEGADVFLQSEVDLLLEELDGTSNKSRLGANATLAVSLACARAGAAAHGLTLFEYIHQILTENNEMSLPTPFMNVLNGGKHAGNDLAVQEFMIVPKGRDFEESVRMGVEVYHALKQVIEKKYGKEATNVGDEGGFAPPLKKTEDALKLLKAAIKKAGHSSKVSIAMDAAASEFYHERKRGKKIESWYALDGKKMSASVLSTYYLKLIKKYGIVSLEDPFEQEAFSEFSLLYKEAKKLGCQVVTDDLTVTNVKRLEKALEEGSGNCLLLKLNQIGTLSEALAAARLAYEHKWDIMVSHRSGETEDSFIADLVVGLGSGQIKAGAPCRGERTAKYNRLLAISKYMKEEML